MTTIPGLPSYTQDEVREHRRTLIDALRSGFYQQGNGKLRPAEHRYCCLGVVEDLRGCRWRQDDDKVGYYVPELRDVGIASNYLSQVGARWFGVVNVDPCVYVGPSADGDDQFADLRARLEPHGALRSDYVTTLASMNDEKIPFTLIADVLERQHDDWDGSLKHCLNGTNDEER